jgi:hypothetical protein
VRRLLWLFNGRVDGSDKLTGVSGHLEERRSWLERPGDSRSMSLFRRLVGEALAEIAVENGGSHL